MTAPKRPEPGARKGAAKAAKATQPRPTKPPVEKQPARGPLMAKLHKALKAQYKPVPTDTSRPLLHQVLHACLLEDAPPEAADKALVRLLESFYDLNEIRVTTVAELAEALPDLPDPERAALALRRVLQSVFESTYTFSLEHARKHSLTHGIRTLEQLHGTSPFVVQHIVATALGGHVVPLDLGALTALFLCGIITQAEYDAGKVPGLERAIGKKAVVEFHSLLHQFGVECLTHLHGATVKKVLQAVNPAAKDRFPKRGEPVPPPNPPPPANAKEQQKVDEAARQSAEAHRPAGPQAAARPAGKTPLPPPGAGPKRTDGKAGGKPGPKPFVVKPNMGKPPSEAAPPPAAPAPAPPKTAAKKPAGTKASAPKPAPAKPAAPKPATAKPAAPKPSAAKATRPPARGERPAKTAEASKGHARQLAKRKPR